MKKLKYFINRIYRLSLKAEKQEVKVWEDLKRLHTDAKWHSGVFENRRFIETVFSINENETALFFHMIYDDCLHCRVKVLENFPNELATDMFVLAAHLNNLLTNGVVVVNTNGNYVEFHQKRELLIPLLYNGEIHNMIIRHFNTSKDIHAAFQRLVTEQEPPAIIVADMLRKKDEGSPEPT